jgi:hypothetical protein
MTIDELLAEAQRYTKLALNNTTGDRATLAQIAQACAQTAQAMMLAQMITSTGTDGETFRPALRVDTGA